MEKTETLYQRLRANRTDDPDQLFEILYDWVSARGIELYPAQEEAILELFTGQHVILKTPTGSGKSMVALAMHLLSLAKGKRAIYTSPIKALVNEKFLDLCEVFGPAQVGMSTGDSTVNRDAPILCCTAEVLANMALREGEKAPADYIVMDEFHYYADRERGVAWQIPLLLLTKSTFLLMSATLGDTTAIEEGVKARTGRDVVCVSSSQRPVPLEFNYSETPLHETVQELVRSARAPSYLVNFTQREAAEQAQNLMSFDVTSKDDKKAIASELAGFRFDTPYGREMQRFLRHGVGIHHGGMLPKYRLLVEKLARAGLLKVVSGTDTLGVGVNIPIRSVIFTKLCKFDGEKTRILSVREFKQIAGRAGRKGYDDRGWVIAQAPEHVIENKKLDQQVAAAALEGKKKKVTKKAAPTKGYVAWTDQTFEQLYDGIPEPLESTFQVTHGMLVELLQRPDNVYVKGGGHRRLIELIGLSHESPRRKSALRRKARGLFQSLRHAGIIELRAADYWRGHEVVVSDKLQTDFSLMQTLALFLVEALTTLSPESPEYHLDVLSFCEAIIENPSAILFRQLDKLKGELLSQWKEEGIEYEERMRRLEEVSWPKPQAELLYQLFNTFSEKHPWVREDNVRPKSVMRDMFERYMSFNEYVKELGLERIEGTLLRYISEGFKVLIKTVPAEMRTDELMDLIAFFRVMLARVDSSLIQEWETMMYGESTHGSTTSEAELALDITKDKKALRARVRAEMHAILRALANEDWDDVLANIRQREDDIWTAERLRDSLEPFFEAFGELRFDHVARMADKTILTQREPYRWVVRQIICDPEGENEWAIEGEIDLRNERAPEGPLIALERISD